MADDEEEGLDFETSFSHPFARDTLHFVSKNLTSEDLLEFTFDCVGPSGTSRLRPALRLPGLQQQLREASRELKQAMEQAMLGVGMSLLCYVWMGFLTPRIVVEAAPLDERQLAFWRLVIMQSLREHFFVNGIASLDGKQTSSLEDLVLECKGAPAAEDPRPPEAPAAAGRPAAKGRRVLVPMGAGKDSTVAWELLSSACGGDVAERRWFFLEGENREFERCWRYRALAEASGREASKMLVAEMVWPTADFERTRNKTLAMAGHPWACMVCFAATLAALAFGYSDVAVGNERSAGEGNGVEWQGVEVNHQWDKSFSFEREAHLYLQRHCQGRVAYFSVLSPLWDAQVGLLFGHLCRKYWTIILSCNQPEGPCASRWCGRCAKCAFVAAVLGAFLPVSSLRAIFGDDPFEAGALTGHLDRLAGLGEEASKDDVDGSWEVPTVPAPARSLCRILWHPWKPLECVGGAAETRLALELVAARYAKEGIKTPRFFTQARLQALRGAAASDPGLQLLDDWSEEHFLPDWLSEIVRTALQRAGAALRQELPVPDRSSG